MTFDCAFPGRQSTESFAAQQHLQMKYKFLDHKIQFQHLTVRAISSKSEIDAEKQQTPQGGDLQHPGSVCECGMKVAPNGLH